MLFRSLKLCLVLAADGAFKFNHVIAYGIGLTLDAMKHIADDRPEKR